MKKNLKNILLKFLFFIIINNHSNDDLEYFLNTTMNDFYIEYNKFIKYNKCIEYNKNNNIYNIYNFEKYFYLVNIDYFYNNNNYNFFFNNLIYKNL